MDKSRIFGSLQRDTTSKRRSLANTNSNDAHWLIQIPTTLNGHRKQKDTTLFIRAFKIQNGVKESQCKSS